jgi:hypothetical protein
MFQISQTETNVAAALFFLLQYNIMTLYFVAESVPPTFSDNSTLQHGSLIKGDLYFLLQYTIGFRHVKVARL